MEISVVVFYSVYCFNRRQLINEIYVFNTIVIVIANAAVAVAVAQLCKKEKKYMS